MIELNGKYNNAKVFTDNIDGETISQVINLLNQEYIKDAQIRIMPDCHAGAGCVIGTTMTLTDKVCCNLVGVDIGCGMKALKLEETEIDLQKLDDVINTFVPSGFNRHEHPVAQFEALNDILAPVDVENANKSIGSLGGGNHFLEVDRDDDNNLWLVIHTGSRHLGIEICNHYQKLAIQTLKKDKSLIQDTIAELKAAGRQKEIETAIRQICAQRPSIPDDLCYVSGQDFHDYLHDMEIAQQYAMFNRHMIADIICDKMGLHIVDEFDTIHNYIDIEHMILRKGSVSAQKGERLIIPMNMRDGSLICTGKGNPDWNYSAPHGAGRILSRSAAKDCVDMDDFKESMTGIYSTSVTESTIDESPMVYKPMQEIMENIKDTVSIDMIIKPIYNFKAH